MDTEERGIEGEAFPPLDVLAAADAAVAATRLTTRATEWAERLGPPFDPALAPMCALPAAFVAPWMSRRGARLTVRTGLWIFALDAWTDGPAARREPVRLRVDLAALRAVARGTAPAKDALGTALAQIRDDVAASPAILPPWQRAVDAALAGALFEYEAALRMRAGGPAPTLGEYLRHGAASIALAPLVLAMWSDMSPPAPAGACTAAPPATCAPAPSASATTVHARSVAARSVPATSVPARSASVTSASVRSGSITSASGTSASVPAVLRRPLRDACLAVRLANDLRGHHRERDEGVVDALALGLPPDEVRCRITRHVARCRRGLGPHLGAQPGPALALERQLLWSVRHYEQFDAGHAA
ncbi:terpene synthase family protein [Actinomadura macra]|uniref:terpene synthase family protein n=1 Tax=Actinomadura macra TaxID=46164 RepID=UPI0008319BE5|nr:terpene synthase family protein [Actinomadura macra]